MKKILPIALVAAALSAFAGAEYPELPEKITDETPAQKAERMAWWRHDRFGMFIHFGLYAMPARHEWIKNREAIADADYNGKYFARFNPDLFDAKAWARAAKAAGMKYMVLTSKHHEGFCLWDTKTTEFRITNTPFGRDLVKEYVEACRAEGLKVGFYFSLMDWNCPDYFVDTCHPLMVALRRRNLPPAELEKEVAKLNAGRDMNRFRKMMFDQVTELLTNYGKIDIIWYDFTPKAPQYGKTYKDWNAVELVKHTRRLQPGIIMDNRLDLMDTDDGWDFVTPEQFKVQTAPTVRGKDVPWETCQTFSGSWGYHRDETSWKNMPQLIGLLVHSVSKGGNLILNVGPTGRGEFDYRANERLDGFAKWMHANSRAIYGCGPAPAGFTAPDGTILTYNEKTGRLYIHLFDYPMGYLPAQFWDRVDYAQFLHDGSEIFVKAPRKRHSQDGEQKGEFGGFTLPMLKPNVEVPVIEVWLKKCGTNEFRVSPTVGDATAAIQGAIDSAFKAGGGKVVVGKGEWPVKALRLRSRVTLYLESGALIRGSRNIDDYFILDNDAVEPVPREWITHEAWTLEQSCSLDNFTKYPASRWNNGLIRLLNAEDAAIVGEPGSVIDGMNPFDPIGEEFYRGPQGVSAINCRRLTLRGYTIRQTGNWAHRIADTTDLTVENVTCEAGHDGVHINGCDGVTIRKCTFKTGDDCVAGFDNVGILVEDCYINTACSGFRFAGTDVTIRRCTLKGPAEYGFRGSLSKEDKASGAPSGKAKRNNMLSFFTYYSDGTHPVRRNAGRIDISDCTCTGADRLLHYNYGNEKWQRGKPMTDITFRNVKASLVRMPASAWGDRAVPVKVAFKDCEIAFATPQPEFIRGSYISGVELENVRVTNVNGPLVRLWNADALKPVVRVKNVTGVGSDVVPATASWSVRGI